MTLACAKLTDIKLATILGQRDDSAGKGACQAQLTELDPRDPHSGKREPVPSGPTTLTPLPINVINLNTILKKH